jgi:macrolide-specific efflux system membrane fusion protein
MIWETKYATFSNSVIIKILLICIYLLMHTGCSFFPKEEEVLSPPLVQPEEITYDTIEVKKSNIERKITGTGYFVPVFHNDLFFKYRGGRIKAIYVKEGDIVKKGDLIAELDSDSLANQIKQQEILLRMAQLDYDSAVESGANKYITEKAALNVELVKLKLDDLKVEFDKSKIISPVAGQVVYRNPIGEGQQINVYSTVARIADPSQLQLEYSDSKINDFQLGMKVQVNVGSDEYEGEVIMTPANMPKDANENIKKAVRIKVFNLAEDVRLGNAANIFLVLEKKEDVIVLSKSLINNFSGRRYVRVLRDGIPEEQDVELGIQTDIQVEVVEGLKEGDLVIIR